MEGSATSNMAPKAAASHSINNRNGNLAAGAIAACSSNRANLTLGQKANPNFGFYKKSKYRRSKGGVKHNPRARKFKNVAMILNFMLDGAEEPKQARRDFNHSQKSNQYKANHKKNFPLSNQCSSADNVMQNPPSSALHNNHHQNGLQNMNENMSESNMIVDTNSVQQSKYKND